MTALDLLADFRRAGIELFADAGRLRFRAPAGALTASMREAVAAHREELLALVALPNGWDSVAAADALSDCNSFLNAALTDSSLTTPQRAVAEVMRGVVRTHAEHGDPLLWSDRAFLDEQVAGWKAVNLATARTTSLAPLQVSFGNISHPKGWWRTGDEPDLLDLVKELFPPDGAARKVDDWRPTGPRNANAAPTPPRRKTA
jgi:hypothetical protein